MSNFESTFDIFLDSLSISRALKQQLKHDWNGFMLFLRDHLEGKKQKRATDRLRPSTTSAYIAYLRQKYRTHHRADTMTSVFDQFRQYLGRQRSIGQNASKIHPALQSLLLDYLTDLQQQQHSVATIRNYQADLLQCFSFLWLVHPAVDPVKTQRLPEGFESRFALYLGDRLHLSAASVKRKSSALRSFVNWAEKKGSFTRPVSVESLLRSSPPTSPSVQPVHALREVAPTIRGYGAGSYIFSLLSGLICLACFAILFYRLGTIPPHQAVSEASSPYSVLRYEGRLTDESGLAIMEKRTARFRIWDDPYDGTVLYDSGSCAVEPDHNGIFSVLIGSSCGKPMPANLLSGHLPLHLGISLEDLEELVPRQALATVNLSQNAYKLAGLSPANPAASMTIPYINQNGTLSISAVSPVLQSQKGTFVIEGQSLVLRTRERTAGSITLAPDHLGTVDIRFNDSLGPQTGGLTNITNTNMITGTLLSLRGSVLTSGYNFIDFRSGTDDLSRFRVDSAGNTFLTGALTVENVLEASPSGITLKSPLVHTGLQYDGGLGLYGSKGNPIPVATDFTQPTRIEFGFKTSNEPMHADINLNEDRLKFYRVFWNQDGMMGIASCTPTCSTMASSSLSRNESIWHHGYIEYSAGSIHWNIDNNKARTTAKESLVIPALQKGYLRFSDRISAIAQLRISQTSDSILTSGNGQVGGSLVAAGNIMTDNQLRPGNFSDHPTSAGSGALYFSTSDSMLYYWNGTSWISDTFWKREGNSLYPHPSYAADLNLGIGTSSPFGRVNIQDTTQEQLRLSWDTTHYARFVASSSGTLAIDPTTDLLVSGNVSVGSGGVFYPSENATHGQQSSYYLTADTSGGGQIRTNAMGFGASGSDFAEVFAAEEPVEAGDVVMLALGEIQHSIHSIAKSNSAYNDKIIGVVTKRAAFIGGLNEDIVGKPTATVGLLGRVPIHVTTENGPIRRGDPLASSSLSGYAMRATVRGPIIARALEDFSTAGASTTGTILSFVQSGWFEPTESVQVSGDLLIKEKETSYQSALTTANQILFQTAAIALENVRTMRITAVETITATLKVKDTAEIGSLRSAVIEIPDSSDGFGALLIQNDQQETVAKIDSQGNAEFSGSVKANDAVFSAAEIAGDATVSGTLYAESIVSDELQSLQSSFSALLARLPISSAPIVPVNLPSPTPSVTPVDPSPPPISPYENYQLVNQIANIASENSDNLLAELSEQLSRSDSLQQRLDDFLASSSGLLASNRTEERRPFARIAQDIDIPPDLRLSGLQVTGSTTLADTAVAGQLFVDGSLLLEKDSIRVLSDKLSLTADKAISLMGDRLIVDDNGNLTTSGWLVAKTGIVTNRINSYDGAVTIDLGYTGGNGWHEESHPDSVQRQTQERASAGENSGQDPGHEEAARIGTPLESNLVQTFGMLLIKGEHDAAVTTVDAIGNLTTQGTLTAAQADIRGILHAERIALDEASSSANQSVTVADHYLSRGINAPAVYAVSSAGVATIPAGSHELYIYYHSLSENSLIYITPTSSTQNRTLFVADKKPGSHVVIALDAAISTPVRFNWWIIN